ncbi:UvrD-helicase domain-containing protein [Sulfurirhabdus autotrophica]|nr:UvrD-helicase domain-containing protein [Sulfurirhabdus autotrophica]
MLSHLNAPQREAVKYLDGPLLVLAGAGSGKTRVITHKIVYLIEECGYSPQHIAAITFTNKASREMQARVSKLLQGNNSKGLTVTTFHSLGMQILRQEAKHLGYKPQFSILDASDSMSIVSDILKTTDKKEIRRGQTLISNWKNAMLSPVAAMEQAESDIELQYATVYRTYQATLQAYQAMDFDDLIRLPVELFDRDATVLEKWQNKLRYLLIDEYQDTNTCQYRMVKQIAGVQGAFTAVGDDDQAIYAWRGANVENLRILQDDFSRLHVIKLEQNYRSTVRILRAANTLIANNPKLFEKKLWSDLGMGETIQVVAARDEDQEAENVVMRLQSHKFENRTKFSDYAILYRGNHQARIFEQYLRNARIPYQLSGGTSFFDRTEIKDIIAYLRLLANSDDDPAFIRAVTTPKRGIGAQTLEKLGNYAAGRHISLFAAAFEAGMEHQLGPKQYEPLMTFCNYINNLQFRAERESCESIMQDLLQAIAYEAYLFDQEEARAAQSKWSNVLDFVGWLNKKAEADGKNVIELTQLIALLNILEGRDEGEVDMVRLSTLHAAKGLEFGHVFLVGIEEGILPHRESIENGQIEEERRLMYVGITRAQKSLTLTHCKKRKRAGEWQMCEPSRFIDELAQEDLRVSGRESDPATQKAEGTAKLDQLKAMLSRKAGVEK